MIATVRARLAALRTVSFSVYVAPSPLTPSARVRIMPASPPAPALRASRKRWASATEPSARTAWVWRKPWPGPAGCASGSAPSTIPSEYHAPSHAPAPPSGSGRKSAAKLTPPPVRSAVTSAKPPAARPIRAEVVAASPDSWKYGIPIPPRAIVRSPPTAFVSTTR